MSRRVHVVMDDELVAAIDGAKGPGQSRGDWIRRALEEASGAEPGGQAVSVGEGRSSRAEPVGAGSTPARPAKRDGGGDGRAAGTSASVPPRASAQRQQAAVLRNHVRSVHSATCQCPVCRPPKAAA